MNETILIKYLKQELTEEERQWVVDWLKQSADHQAQLFELELLYRVAHNTYDRQSDDRRRNALERLNRQIDAQEGNAKISLRRRILMWSSAAALLLLLVVSGYYCRHLLLPEGETLSIYICNESPDRVDEVTLPDGSSVWLAPNSSIRYEEFVAGKPRVVALGGEAFFEVVPDPYHPFYVKTAFHDVKVLGTSFEVNTHPDKPYMEVLLMNGLVQLEKEGEPLALLNPGEQALFEKGGETLKINNVDVNTLTSWRFGLITLTEVSINEILDCLEHTYNISIRMNTKRINNRSYNFSFKKSKGAKAALQRLTDMTGEATCYDVN